MSSLEDTIFVVTDIETTGSKVSENNIIDIAYVIVKNFEIIDEFHSLVNPGQFIPPFITNMTGITNTMVFNAPTPAIALKKIYEYLKDDSVIFVAHNAPFDWSFIKYTIQKSMGEKLSNSKICTYDLAKKLMPDTVKKNVGDLARYFKVPINNRHRAYDDAFATAHILIEFLKLLKVWYDFTNVQEIIDFSKNRAALQTNKIDRDKFKNLLDRAPNKPGLICFKKDDTFLYIEYCFSIKDTILYYIDKNNSSSFFKQKLIYHANNIVWHETQNELEAKQKLEQEVTKHEPEYNTIIQTSNSDYTNKFLETTLNSNFLTDKLFVTKGISDSEVLFIYNLNSNQITKPTIINTKNLNNSLLQTVISELKLIEKPQNSKPIFTKTITNWLIKNKNNGIFIDKNQLFSDTGKDYLKNIIKMIS